MSERLTVYLTVRVAVDPEELARHLVWDRESQSALLADSEELERALVEHIRPMLEEPSWDSPSKLTVVAVIREERDSE